MDSKVTNRTKKSNGIASPCQVKYTKRKDDEVLKRIRAVAPRLKVFAQTAYASKSDESRIQRAGFDGYLAKPIRYDVLANALGTSLASEPGGSEED